MRARGVVRKLIAGPARRLGEALRDPQTEHDRCSAAWFKIDGDGTLRQEYPLDRNSVVLDVGGYRGQWASDIFGRYLPTIHVFEPVPPYAEAIADRFRLNDQVTVHAVALTDRDGIARISIADDRSSSSVAGETKIVTVRAATYLQRIGVSRIDLLKVNIEGDEYDFLDHLFDVGVAQRISDIQIQFHDFVPNAIARAELIRSRLRETHDLSWQFPWVWESWRRRSTS